MNTKTLWIGLGSLLLFGAGTAKAEDLKFWVTFRGTCVSTNAAGAFVTRPVTQATWLQEYAKANGVNPRSIGAVYHFNADSRGDQIEIVNLANGAVLATPFLLFFGQDASLDRTALTNGIGNQVKIIQYVYTPQSGHSLGDAVLSEYFLPNRPANLPSVIIRGTMNYLVKADGEHNPAIFNGVLATGKPALFPNAP